MKAFSGGRGFLKKAPSPRPPSPKTFNSKVVLHIAFIDFLVSWCLCGQSFFSWPLNLCESVKSVDEFFSYRVVGFPVLVGATGGRPGRMPFAPTRKK